jgi:hypothetical protein
MFVMQGLCVLPLQSYLGVFRLMFSFFFEKKKKKRVVDILDVRMPPLFSLLRCLFWPDDWIMGKAEILWDLRHIPRGLTILAPVRRCSSPRNVRRFCRLPCFFSYQVVCPQENISSCLTLVYALPRPFCYF